MLAVLRLRLSTWDETQNKRGWSPFNNCCIAVAGDHGIAASAAVAAGGGILLGRGAHRCGHIDHLHDAAGELAPVVSCSCDPDSGPARHVGFLREPV